MTFCLHKLSQSMSAVQHSDYFVTPEKRPDKDDKKTAGTVILTAISISSVLSFAWMAVNPPSSPNFTKKKEKEKGNMRQN